MGYILVSPSFWCPCLLLKAALCFVFDPLSFEFHPGSKMCTSEALLVLGAGGIHPPDGL